MEGTFSKEFNGLTDRHFKNIGNGFSFVSYFKGLAVVPLAVAFLARHEHIGKKIHLYRTVPVASACLAASAGDIEREAARFISSYFGLRKLHEEFAYVGEHTRICSRILISASVRAETGPR